MAGELSMSHSILVEQAGRLVRELEISPAHAARIVSAAMTRIQNAGRGGFGVEEWVGELRSALTPICGSAMADISMRRAAYEAAQSTVDALTETDWEDFVSHLSSHVASLCGRAAGSLIARTGAQIGMETTA